VIGDELGLLSCPVDWQVISFGWLR